MVQKQRKARPSKRGFIRAVVVGLFCLALMFSFIPAFAANNSASLTAKKSLGPTRQTGEKSQLTLSIVDISPRIISNENQVTFSIKLQNNTSAPLPALNLELTQVNSSNITAEQLPTWVNGSLERRSESIFKTALTPPSPGIETKIDIKVPTSDFIRLNGGPKLVAINAVKADGTVLSSDRSIILAAPTKNLKPSLLNVIVPVTYSLEETYMARKNGASVARVAEKRLSDLAEKGPMLGLTLAIDPQTVDPLSPEALQSELTASGYSMSGSKNAPPTLQKNSVELGNDSRIALGAILKQSRSFFFLPWGNSNVDQLDRQGQTALAQYALHRRNEIQKNFSSSGLISAFSWPHGGSIDRKTILKNRSMPMFLPPQTFTPNSELTFTPDARINLDEKDLNSAKRNYADSQPNGQKLILANREINAALDPNFLSGRADADLDSTQAAIGIMAVITDQRPFDQRGFVAAASLKTHPDLQYLNRVKAVLNNPWVKAVPLQEIINAKPTNLRYKMPPASITSPNTGPQVLTDLGKSTLEQIQALPTTKPDTELRECVLTLGLSRQTLGLNGNSPATKILVNDIEALNTFFSHAITAQAAPSITVIDTDVELPVRISNALPEAVEVAVRLRPSDARLQATHTQVLTIPARGENTTKIPIRAIGAGKVQLNVEVVGKDDSVISTSAPSVVYLNTGFEAFGTRLVLIIGAALIVLGVIRTISKRRRHRRELKQAEPTSSNLLQSGSMEESEAAGSACSAAQGKQTERDQHCHDVLLAPDTKDS